MKKLFLLMVVLVCATVSFAQNTLVATLTHGDEIKMFYGNTALQKALAASVHGDVICLSGGDFYSTTITKAVTIRGMGMDVDNPTSLLYEFDVNIPSDVTEELYIEGCRISDRIIVKGVLKNPHFVKDYFYYFSTKGDGSSSRGSMLNGIFTNCDINKIELYGNTSAQVINSFVGTYRNYSEALTTANFINCLIYTDNNLEAESSIFLNCIIHYSGKLTSSNAAINCISFNNKNLFDNLSLKENCWYTDSSIFIDSDYKNDLTDAAKAKYLGDDNTPVGVYGGIFPYNTIPSYPRITKMNVANRTTADNKLSVEIEVSAAQ